MAKLFTAEQIRKADVYTVENEPIASIDLMERAAVRLKEWITGRFGPADSFKLFIGPGNNGGDGLALTRLLISEGFRNVTVYLAETSKQRSQDSGINYQRLLDLAPEAIFTLNSSNDFPVLDKNDIAIDALFGSGLSKLLEGLTADLVRHLNASDHNCTIAVDIPSGLFADSNEMNFPDTIIRADYTLTFQFPKLSFFFPENSEFIGEWHVMDIGLHRGFTETEFTPYNSITLEDARERIRERKKFSHKGNYGHALLIAGSYGMMGAAVLSVRAAVRAGTGLVTTHVPRIGVDVIHQSVPESLVSVDSSETQFSHYPDLTNFSAVGIGPGLGKDPRTKEGLIELLQEVRVSLVIDADGLNLLSSIKNWKQKLPVQTILTPHPKEFERLFGVYKNSFSRLQAQLDFSRNLKCVIVLKGAHTCITTPDGNAWFNTTGNPGMAKGGSGDVLTGLILGLLAQGYSITDASVLGVFLHGMAGDMSADESGEYGLIPSDIIQNIGKAFNVLEKKA